MIILKFLPLVIEKIIINYYYQLLWSQRIRSVNQEILELSPYLNARDLDSIEELYLNSYFEIEDYYFHINEILDDYIL